MNGYIISRKKLSKFNQILYITLFDIPLGIYIYIYINSFDELMN